MKKDIVVIRESISRIVSMLTRQSIKVTQRGSQARVSYHPKTGQIIDINLPFIPDDASDEFVSAVQGFLDHEVGHVLFSDFGALKRANKLGPRVANLANLVEDVFVERKMAEAFQGSGSNLESVRGFYLEKIARPKIMEALKAGDIEGARGYATVAAFRAWGGQAIAMDFIKDPAIAELVAVVRTKIGEDLLDKLSLCKTSDECLDLAIKIKDKLEVKRPPLPPPPAASPSPPPPPPPPPPEPEIPDPDYDESEGEPEEGDDDDSGTTVPKSDLGEALKPEEKPPLSDEPEETEPSPAPPPEPEGSSEEPEGTEEDGDDGDGTGGVMVESDAPEGVEKEAGDGGSEPGADPEEASTGAPDDEGGSPSGTPGAPDEAYLDDPLAEMFDEERDFDKDMSERLSEEASSEIHSSDYAVFSKEWDAIDLARPAHNATSIAQMEGSLGDKLGVMQKMLERSIAAQAKKAWSSGQRRGRISPGSLFKTAAGDDRVFRQRFETKAKNTAVSLLVDCSGSMGGSKIKIAGQAAYALSTILERLKITHEVIGFTTTSSHEMMNLMQEDASSQGKTLGKMGWGRVEALYMPVFKSFNGRLDVPAKMRLAGLQEGCGWLNQNVDGECVQIAAGRLKQQKAERHILIVLSDGEPAAIMAKGLNPHLKKVVKDTVKAGVEVIGIGIESSSVKAFYPKHVILNDADELPGRVMAELTKLLLAP